MLKITNVYLRNLLKKKFLLKVSVVILTTCAAGKIPPWVCFFIYTISGLDKGASYLNAVYLNPLISFHFTCAASASTEPGRKDCPFYTCLTLFLFYKCCLCVSCPNTITPRCPIFIRFLFSLWLLQGVPLPSLPNLPEQRRVFLSLHKSNLLFLC